MGFLFVLGFLFVCGFILVCWLFLFLLVVWGACLFAWDFGVWFCLFVFSLVLYAFYLKNCGVFLVGSCTWVSR